MAIAVRPEAVTDGFYNVVVTRGGVCIGLGSVSQPYVSFHAIDMETQKCIHTRKLSSPSSGQFISQPAIEFGKAMKDLTDILQRADGALKSMLVAFEHIAHYVKNETYISIVQSKAYEAVDSVRALFRLLAPHLQPVDCSLLKALVEAAGVEQAIQRLNEYLHMTNNCLLDSGSEKVHTPHEMETLSQISSQPVADSTSMPVTTVVEAKEMSWGVFRYIKSLLCGIFTVPSCALQYDDKKPGSVVVTCITSLVMLSEMKSTLLDDSDMLLLLREKIISIQVGKDYTIAVGNHDYWMVSNTPKAVIEIHRNAKLCVFACQNLNSECPITY